MCIACICIASVLYIVVEQVNISCNSPLNTSHSSVQDSPVNIDLTTYVQSFDCYYPVNRNILTIDFLLTLFEVSNAGITLQSLSSQQDRAIRAEPGVDEFPGPRTRNS